MRNIARYVVDTHCHISTLYQPKEGDDLANGVYDKDYWTGLNGNVEHFDNSDLTIYDMDRYGVDMAVLLPSMLGTSNESQIKIMDKYPGRFASCCSDGKTLLKYYNDRSTKYNFQEALDEVEAALKTGRFCGIGEFVPGLNAALYGLIEPMSMEERMEQWTALCALGAKYDVPLHYHDFLLGAKFADGLWKNYNYDRFIEEIARNNPKAKIIVSHGGKDPFVPNVTDFEAAWKDFYQMAAAYDNIYLECGGWCEKNFEIAFENDVPAHRIMWGHDYGNVPQYLMRKAQLKKLKMRDCALSRGEEIWNYRKTDSVFGGVFEGMPPVPTYQGDFYGWGMRTMDRIGDWVTQDEINLMMGGTAARLFKLPVPHSRMFAEAREDIFGKDWKEKWYPFIPDEQIQNPDPNGFRLPTNKFDVPTDGTFIG